MSKFARCHPADGFVWCQHFNGSWAPPFPARQEAEKEKRPRPAKKEGVSPKEKA
jgi:hypothetical protein